MESDEEKIEWKLSLEHHYAHNRHHPEYFGNELSILDTEEHGKVYLEESLIDMLAARGERMLKNDPTISIKKWMDIDDQFIARYSETDKKYVKELLRDWTNLATTFVTD